MKDWLRFSGNHVIYGWHSENSGWEPPKSTIFNRVFHFKPSILGVPLFLETPICHNLWANFVNPHGKIFVYCWEIFHNNCSYIIPLDLVFWPPIGMIALWKAFIISLTEGSHNTAEHSCFASSGTISEGGVPASQTFGWKLRKCWLKCEALRWGMIT